ncbi:MAG: phytanoyl-CoA dioxygenase family protein [Lentisphaeria bacterium]|nr:phytanoyl-CoA dioxygenase family protein [Lentisphaeria bacterium]NQZ70144.1 phytanoyl-CoA dioxygenase family protein [Lentisphaeria bacterium]
MEPRQPSEMDRYLFDLKGFIHLENALSSDEVDACNRDMDSVQDLNPGEWHGYVQCHQFSDNNGKNLQQIYELPAYQPMINHPSWIDYIKMFIGGEGTFDYKHGPLFIDEAFGSIREHGEAIFIHSGGHTNTKRNMYHFSESKFMCNQVNVLVALTDIGPGDGGTVLIPSSHKSNIEHPCFRDTERDISSADGVEAAIEVHMNKGDAIIFSDWICHGAAARTKEGQRRIFVYRYGPSWGMFRHPYRPSKDLMDALGEEAKGIVWPHDPIPRQPNRLENIPNPDQVRARQNSDEQADYT